MTRWGTGLAANRVAVEAGMPFELAHELGEAAKKMAPKGPNPVISGLVAALPIGLGASANLAKTYKDMYLDPGVETVTSKADTRKRAKFTEEQLQQLLRGLSVDEVKTKAHFIK